jgi:hypothetical protein
MSVDRFFKDKHGKVVVAQAPNVLISIWLVLQLADLIVLHGKYQPVRILATAVLFAWAYDELRRGDSQFRKVLGAAVLLGIVITTFIH